MPVDNFIGQNGKLPHSTLIMSISNFESDEWERFIKHIDFTNIDHVTYIHAIGSYPFEVDEKGKIVIENDKDEDGINDEVMKLTYTAFTGATKNIIKNFSDKITSIIFGGIADKHRPAAHSSWWKVIEKTKDYMRSTASERVAMIIFNISSVICPHEIITRPYVFIKTDADQKYWLHPYEFAQFLLNQSALIKGGFHEIEKYRIYPEFDPEYYTDKKFTPRKVDELYSNLLEK